MESKERIMNLEGSTWTEIFLHIEGYRDLKRLAQVCVHFEELIEAAVFDKFLFRSELSAHRTFPNESVILHPILYKINSICTDYQTALNPLKPRESIEENISEEEIKSLLATPVFREFATYPAVCTIAFNISSQLEGAITNEGGLLVKNVLDKIIQLWSQKPSLATRKQFVEDGVSESVETATYFDKLGKNNQFVRWIVQGRPPIVFFELEATKAATED